MSIQRVNIATKVIELIKQYHDDDTIVVNESDSLRDNLSIDSLDRVEIIIELEKKFNIYFPQEAYESSMVKTVSDLINAIENQIKNQ